MTIEYIISESLKYGIHFDYKDFRYVSHKDRKVKFIFIILNDCLYWVGQKEDFEISHLSYCIEVLTNEKLSKLENIKKDIHIKLMRNGIYVYKHNLLVDCEISSHGIYDIDVYYEINNENILLLTKRNYYSSSIDDIQENIINYN